MQTEASITNTAGFLVLGGRVEESGFNRPGMVAHGETGGGGDAAWREATTRNPKRRGGNRDYRFGWMYQTAVGSGRG